MLRVGQTESCSLKQNVRVVWADLRVLNDHLDELGKDLAKSRCKWHEALFAQLDNSQQTSHRIQVLILVKELANVLQE